MAAADKFKNGSARMVLPGTTASGIVRASPIHWWSRIRTPLYFGSRHGDSEDHELAAPGTTSIQDDLNRSCLGSMCGILGGRFPTGANQPRNPDHKNYEHYGHRTVSTHQRDWLLLRSQAGSSLRIRQLACKNQTISHSCHPPNRSSTTHKVTAMTR